MAVNDLTGSVDATYADDPQDPSRQVHQQDHDEIHSWLQTAGDISAAVLTGNSVLEDLSDVTESTITTGDLLRWNGSNWVNFADSNYASSGHLHDTSDVTTGTFANARISEASVTQHQAALSITESQVSDLNHLTIEEVQDNLGTLFLQPGTDISLSYDDVANTLTITSTATGVTDHGALTGLADDDHSQYLNSTRHDSADHSTAMGTVVLDDISDVTETTITTGDVLRWSGTAWVNYADSNFAASGHNHDAAYVNEGDHTKAAHDTLNIDADTVDGSHAADFATSGHGHTLSGDVTGSISATVVGDNSHSHTGTTISALDTGDVTTGTFADARIAQSNVTQHQTALSITESQVSDLSHLTLEQVQDNLGTAFLVQGSDISLTYDDVANTLTIASTATGVTDHGALTGLTDNDHPQYQDIVYHGATAGKARPSVLGRVMWIGSVEPTNAQSDDVWLDTDDPSIAVTTAHNDLNGLTTGDPHTQYLLADGTTVLAGALREGVTAVGNSGASPTVSWADAPIQTMTLTANATLSFANLPSPGGSLVLVLTQDGTGSRTVTWPASVDWPSATAPTLTTTAGGVDVITFITDDSGTTVYGFASGLGMG